MKAVPQTATRREIEHWTRELVPRVVERRRRETAKGADRRSDDHLLRRARELSRQREEELLEQRWKVPPYKFEAGTPHIAGAIGLGAALVAVGAVLGGIIADLMGLHAAVWAAAALSAGTAAVVAARMYETLPPRTR